MTIEQLQAVIDSAEWRRLKYDSLNWGFISKNKVDIDGYACYWVLKELQKAGDELGHPINALVALWNEINPDYPAYETSNGWVSPYLGVDRPSDRKVAMELVNIYRKTRHIIVNAYLSNAFVLLNHRAVCVDLSHALKGGGDESNHSNRIKQFLIGEFEHELLQSDARKVRPLTVATILTLLHWDQQVALKQSITKDTEDAYLIYELIERLHHVSSVHYPITIEHLSFLSEFKEHDRFYQFPTECITPSLIKQMKKVYATGKNVTVEELMDKTLTAHSFARMGDSYSLQLVIEEDKSLLNSIDEEGYTLLQIAARYDCIEIVNFLISLGVDLNRRTPEAIGDDVNTVFANKTALDIAITCKRTPIALALLNAGAEISPAKLLRSHAIHCVVLSNDLTQLKVMLERDPSLVDALDEYHETPLIKAASVGQKGMIMILIDKATESSKVACSSNLAHRNWSAVDFAISGGYFHSIKLLERAEITSNHKHIKIKNRTLFDLIEHNDIESVKLLLQNNIDLLEQANCEGFTPLQYAAFLGKVEIVFFLVSSGAKLNTRMPMNINRYEQSSYPNFSAVDIAFACDQDEIGYFLLSKGAELSHHMNGYRHAIHSCAYRGGFELLMLLIQSNSGLINAKDSNGLTPVCLAAVRGHSEIVEFLIKQSPESLTISIPPLSADYALEHDSLPLDWAIHGGDWPTIRLLLQADAPAAHSYTPAIGIIDKLDNEEVNSPEEACIDEVLCQEVSGESGAQVSLSVISSSRTSTVVANVGFFKSILRTSTSDQKLPRIQKNVHFIDQKLDMLRYVFQKIVIEFTREFENSQKTQDSWTNKRYIRLCCQILSNQQDFFTLISPLDFKWFRSDFIRTLGHIESILSCFQLPVIDDCIAHLLELKTQLQCAEQSNKGSSDDELKSVMSFIRFISGQLNLFSSSAKKAIYPILFDTEVQAGKTNVEADLTQSLPSIFRQGPCDKQPVENGQGTSLTMF